MADEPEFFPDGTEEDSDVIDQTAPGRKLAAMGARGFIREFCWLAPQVYNFEYGEDIIVVPAYRNEFIEMYTAASTANPGNIYNKCISVMLTRRSPAPTRETNNPFDDSRGISPLARIEEKYTDSGGYYTIYGQKFSNSLQFDCWAKSNTEADELIDWLETFLVKWEFWFQALGIDKMGYLEAGSDLNPSEASAMSIWKQPLKIRTLEWYIRDEKLYYLDQSEIAAIAARVQTEGGTRRLEYVI